MRNKYFLAVLSSILLIVFAIQIVSAYGPIQKIPLVNLDKDNSSTDSVPLVFINQNGGRALFDDPYGFFESGNVTLRTNNYIFYGEQISWKVLVWDKSGFGGMNVDSGWVDSIGNNQINLTNEAGCEEDIPQPVNGTDLVTLGYPDVRGPSNGFDQTNFNSNTMKVYTCTLTIEMNCNGQKWLGVKAIKNDLQGIMQESEAWTCNPALSLDVSGNFDFGTVGPGEKRASTISIKNKATDGVEVILAISGTDFYDPSSSSARCPDTNKLSLQGVDAIGEFETGFWYTAVQGSKSSGKKRIPYGLSITNSDPVFSTSNPASQWRKWTGTPVLTSPGSSTTLTLHLGKPEPCSGHFSEGNITLWALPV